MEVKPKFSIFLQKEKEDAEKEMSEMEIQMKEYKAKKKAVYEENLKRKLEEVSRYHFCVFYLTTAKGLILCCVLKAKTSLEMH